ncbi:hypothetical protein MBANPS3_008827, partial [Mucor bainieri]
MNRVSALCDEILLMTIFSNIESLNQLATCRLVQKAWTNPAMNLMFGREIVVDYETQAIRLLRYSLLHPTTAKVITSMCFRFDGTEAPLMAPADD